MQGRVSGCVEDCGRGIVGLYIRGKEEGCVQRAFLWRLCLGCTQSPQQFTVAYIKVLVVYSKHFLNSSVVRRLNLHLWRILVMQSGAPPACVWWMSPSKDICFRLLVVTTAQLWGTLSCCFMLRCIHTPPRIPVTTRLTSFQGVQTNEYSMKGGHTREGTVWRQVLFAIWIYKWLLPLFWWSHRDFESQGKHSI